MFVCPCNAQDINLFTKNYCSRRDFSPITHSWIENLAIIYEKVCKSLSFTKIHSVSEIINNFGFWFCTKWLVFHRLKQQQIQKKWQFVPYSFINIFYANSVAKIEICIA